MRVAYAQSPEPPLIVPSYQPGDTYLLLVEYSNLLFTPINDLVDVLVGWIPLSANDIVVPMCSGVATFYSYLGYGSNLVPGMVTASIPIVAWFVVVLVKLVLRAIMYLKNLIANWL